MNVLLALYFTNMLRQSPLKVSPWLDSYAQRRAEYLCTHPFSHDGWTKGYAPTKFDWIGENLAEGYLDLASAYAAWMVSPDHYANLTDKDFQFTGFGQACGITVQEFGGYEK
jgi:uncharacterized protein YkwD